ncbi:hypothetical protein M8C21_029378, partial [Ambrosia artemisiifolia]
VNMVNLKWPVIRVGDYVGYPLAGDLQSARIDWHDIRTKSPPRLVLEKGPTSRRSIGTFAPPTP